MNLYFSVIADELHDLTIRINTDIQNEPPLKDIRFLADGQIYSDDYLYFTTPEQLTQNTSESLPKNLVIAGGALPDPDFSSEHNILYIDYCYSAHILFSRIQDIFTDYQDWHTRIQNAIILHSGIDKVLNIAAEKLDNPIALFDTTASLVQWAGTFSEDISGSIWDNALHKGYTMDYFSYEEWKDLTQKMSNSDMPFLFHSSNDPMHSMLACPLKIGGKFIASLGMTSINAPFTDGQIRLIAFIKEMLEMALNNSTSLRHAAESTSYYVECLLNGLSVDEKIITYYLKRRGWKINDSYCLLNFSYPIKPNNHDTILQPYIGRIEHKFPLGLLCSHEESVIVILNTSDYSVTASDFQDMMQELYEKFQLQCGISAEFYNFLDLKYYYIQSKSALTEGRREKPQQAFYYYLDYYQSNLVHALDSVASLKSLCHPRILQMWKNNDSSQLSLIHTLYTYLLNGQNITTTAAALHIHRNTLLYRLDKISDYLYVDFENLSSDMLFYLLMSCIIIENL
ncbi:MAG: helix-turn-helix domain-containing protein [Clostridiales bacterium]|jgi:hypothetical protein|nr:helix-turn-helix domain-containing protein [Eubacteriales bacterium]MDH7566636.1 helix-turn-helix domain-containing protein [Clostridiales bacterium]